MQDVSQISEFGKILLFLIVGFFAVGATFMLNKLLAPHNPTAEKLTSYECGEEPTGSAWLPFNPRFYVIALIFLLFDVEMVFIFPWSTVFGSHEILAAAPKWGWFALAEMFIFLIILILGLVYVWVKGDLDWIKPKQVLPTVNTVVPNALYKQLNLQQSVYSVKPFSVDTASVNGGISASQPSSEPAPAKRPMFKPAFKKPGNDA